MATLLLAAAGSALGGAIGGSVLGVSTALIGQAVGALAGRAIDQSLMGGLPTEFQQGPRLESLQMMTSSEGEPLISLEGRTKVGGTVIWATKLREEVLTTATEVGSGKVSSTAVTTTFEYFLSLAVSLCEGPATHLGRIWADGRIYDFSDMIAEGRLRFYRGTEEQLPDPLIEAIEGASPAFRGTAYLVFEDMPLAPFGNRVPQISAEIWAGAGDMEALVTGVNVIPGASEWGLNPEPVNQGSVAVFDYLMDESAENNHRFKRVADWALSMDMLGDLLPNAQTTSLVVAWFGTDLRAGLCKIEPRVENKSKATVPLWTVAGLSRTSATLVTQIDGAAAFGSTPADRAVLGAIADLKARGHRVVFYPFIMMDIPGEAALPAPDGVGVQGAFPWRGRIAPRAGKDVGTEVAAFMGQAVPGDFVAMAGPPPIFATYAGVAATAGAPDEDQAAVDWSGTAADGGAPAAQAGQTWEVTHSGGTVTLTIVGVQTSTENGTTRWLVTPKTTAWPVQTVAARQPDAATDPNDVHITYSGPDEWGLRRMVLHYAHLCAAAGGVDAFVIGSELRGLTMARAGDGSYPFVDALRGLAGDVRTVLGASAKLSYAADWSEYHSDRDGGDVRFHLDPLWADGEIDFIGIDNYLPLSDWRPGREHLDFDATNGPVTPYDLDYLKSNIEGGEFWDWFYADQAAREAQVRTPITDEAYGEDWVFRQKAIRDWHGRPHHDRPGGVRSATPTAWVPGSKPVWFTEIGCPAVDLGSNQPNVFFAANSSEAALPYFSAGIRDDFIQRQFLRAVFEWWAANGTGVVDPADIQVWAWDARPWPEFPSLSGLWADSRDWWRGHWLNGRAGAAPAAEAVARRLTRHHGLASDQFDASAAHGQVEGYPASGPMDFRAWMQPLEVALALSAREDSGALMISSLGAAREAPALTRDGMAERGEQLFEATRGAIEDVARAAELRFRNGSFDYDAAVALARIQAGGETGIARAEVPLVLDFDRGVQVADRLLFAAAEGRTSRLVFAAPRSATALRPGMVVLVQTGAAAAARQMLIERVTLGERREVEARLFSPQVYESSAGVFRLGLAAPILPADTVLLEFLDLPLLAQAVVAEWDGVLAAHAAPWPGLVTAARGASQAGSFDIASPVDVPARMGSLLGDLPPGATATWTPPGVSVEVEMFAGTLVSRTPAAVLAGANRLGLRHTGGWEVLHFTTAELIATGRYRLSGFLRGRRGTGHLAAAIAPAGARIVVLDGALRLAGLAPSEVGAPLWWRWGPAARPVIEHQVASHTFQGIGQRPFAPAHLRARHDGADYQITWIRRSRSPVDTWWQTGIDPPLAETSERYRIEIGPATAPLRVVEIADATAFTYTGAMATADGAIPPFALRCAQISEAFGPGVAAQIEVTE